MPRISCRKQNLKLVRLHKDSACGLGMVITCGNTYETILHGAFVESIYSGGPCDIDGNISPGDQIMSINGVDVQNDHFLTVVDLLQHSSSPVELVVAKANKTSNITYLGKEAVEPPFIKTESWITGDENSKDIMLADQKIDSSYYKDMPIPKPRKKWVERDKVAEKLKLDVPDLTLNHSKCNSSPDKDIDSNNISELFTKETCNIPDIIASQMKHISAIPKQDNNFDVSPGEVYHVVLDKKGGSLGLNIYQGTEPPGQRHIYIHSVISGGAAELDGRIKTGDKLLAVNGLSLENLSYQEVVGTLRDSPKVAHLMLEKGNVSTKCPENDKISANNCNLKDFTEDNFCYQTDTWKNSQISSSDKGNNFENCHSNNSHRPMHLDKVIVANNDGDNRTEEKNSFSSLPHFNNTHPSAKETNSAPSSYQHNHSKDSLHKNGQYFDGSISSLNHIKAKNPENVKMLQNTLPLYKSTPNLTENSDEENYCSNGDGTLHRNHSSDCLVSPDLVDTNLAFSDLYQNYPFIRGSSSNIHQIPAVPIRKKKLRKLEDVLSYCNSENTFLVSIRKSSRGLGLSICGGRGAPGSDISSQLIQIQKLYPLQPAIECGKLQVGDVILKVNSTSMIGKSKTEALEALRSAPTDVVLNVFRPSNLIIPSTNKKDGNCSFFYSSSSSASSTMSHVENNMYNVEMGEFEVILIKRGGSLGFTISKKEENSNGIAPEGIYVRALIREPAVSDGRIHPGDQILQVNGTVVSLMSHAEAIAFIRNSADTVTLKVFRSDPPLSPGCWEEDQPITKPLRWEALELLNDRVKQKDSHEECNTLKRKLKRKLERVSNAPSSSSTESSTSSSGQEHVINEEPGLQRNQRPKSLDVLNSSDRNRFGNVPDEESLHRQSSVMCPDSKVANEASKTLLKWRGTTLPDSEEEEVASTPPEKSQKVDSDEEKPVPFPRTTSASHWVRTFDVDLDRGWHGRLGFSLFDPPPTSPDHPTNQLPLASEVKTVYPGSLAEKDGRINVGDRIVEVNGECLLKMQASQVIDILRKTRGMIRMVFCRLETRPE